MVYEFKFTERNVERASEYETKTLLYLLGIDKNRSKVWFVLIDCFNDVTGSNKNCEILWDFQSKGVSNLTPRGIGEALYTLFMNYNSELNFQKFALFIPIPKHNYVLNPSLNEFSISNFEKHRETIREGLEAECIRRHTFDTINSQIKSQIDSFLDNVMFVVDRWEKEKYIKNLVSFKDKDLKTKEFYLEIFEEIRFVQNNKKHRSIHNEKINAICDVLNYNKHIDTQTIKTLVINRLIGVDLFKHRSIPFGFLPEIERFDQSAVKDIVLECKSKICRAIFDKNGKKDFWSFLEQSILVLINNSELTSREVYNIVTNDGQKKFNHLSEKSEIYLISLLKEGVEK
jgi:hypothetical protein